MTHHESEPIDVSRMWSADFWDERYAGKDRLWSGNPNRRLVEQVTGLTPGTAVDVGCGEGADAIWLAQQGWRVTGLDISRVALERAAAHAEQAGVADRTTWRQVDLFDAVDDLPGDADLVTAQFVHAPALAFDHLYGRLAAMVRPGGSFVVAGHHPDDLDSGLRHPEMPDLLFTPERVVAVLDPDLWEIRYAGAPTREESHHHDGGETVRVTDSVVHAVRTSGT